MFKPSTLEELGLHVASGARLDSKYDPTNDIKEFIENMPKPDILVVNNEGVVSIYSNQPEALGTVLRYDVEENPRVPILTIPDKLKDGSKDWHRSLIGLELNEFLEEFIIKNT